MRIRSSIPQTPKHPAEAAEFIETWKSELKVYRKHPLFWGGMIVAGICILVLISRSDTIGRLIMLPMILGVAYAHDVVIGHFTKRLIEIKKERKNRDAIR